jgi:hypothetical protein
LYKYKLPTHYKVTGNACPVVGIIIIMILECNV